MTVHSRIKCAIYLRLAARIAARRPDLQSFLISMHARILSRAIYRGSILVAHLPAIGTMLNIANLEAQFWLSQCLGNALGAAYDALGHPVMKEFDATIGAMIEYRSDIRPSSPPRSSRPRRRPTGEVQNFSDLSFEVDRAERQMDRMMQKGDATAARTWHERLLYLTNVGRNLPIKTHVDAGHVLDDLRRRGKQYSSPSSRILRVKCRALSIELWTFGIQPGMTGDLASALEIALELDQEADGELHPDMSKVVAWLNSQERLLPGFQSSWRNQNKPTGYGPLERAEDDKMKRLAQLETMTLGGQKITRQQVYDMIWAEPVTIVSARFGISDVGLRKLCERRDIPLPPVGYWAHVRRKGKGIRYFRKPPLPPLE